MSFVPMPDGSKIGPFGTLSGNGQVRDTSDRMSLVMDLAPARSNPITLMLLRQMVSKVSDGFTPVPSDDDGLLDEVVRLLQGGSLSWILTSTGESDPGPRGKVGTSAPQKEDAPPPAKPLPKTPEPKKAPPPPPSTPPPPVEKIVVTPELKVEYKVVLFDRDLNKYLGSTETKYRISGTVIEVSFKQNKPSPKFPKGLKLKTGGAGTVEAYEDEEFKSKLDLTKPIPNEKLGSPLKLWLKGKTKGKFDLTLEVETGDDRFKADPAVTEKMGVVEIKMVPYETDVAALDALEVDPDTDPVEQYYTDLKDKALPDQIELADDRKVQVGRLLHVQKDGHFGRAKLVVKKLESTQWPDGTDNYTLVVSASKTEKPAEASTALKIFDAEFDGTAITMPAAFKVSDLKAGDKTAWVEGAEASKKMLDFRLDLGIDRPDGGLAKEIKRNGDWARFTVLQIQEVKLDYTPTSGQPDAWDDADSKFFINFKSDPAGRKVNIKATLSEKLKDVKIRFMLAPNKDNRKAANWGIDLPTTWTWKDIHPSVKHKDRAARLRVMHLSGTTDVNGAAKAELVLSRFGGDKFRPGAYLECDPHLAKYIDGHTDLEKRKPVQAAKDIIVWRKIWSQIVKVEGITVPAMADAVNWLDLVRTEMERTADDIEIDRATVDGFSPQAIYPRYMIELNGSNADALVVSNSNKAQFFSGFLDEADKPSKIPILVCDAQWDEGIDTGPVDSIGFPASTFPIEMAMDQLILDPPLQGGDLLVSGNWIAADWDGTLNGGAGDWANRRNGTLDNGDISVNPARTTLKSVHVSVPASLGATTPLTYIWIQALVVQGQDGVFLGEYDNQTTPKQILCVYKPSRALAEFNHTLTHEVGHALHQTSINGPSGTPGHPHQYPKKGSHCSWNTNKCVMYEASPIPGSPHKFCPVCHPYVLITNMSKLA